MSLKHCQEDVGEYISQYKEGYWDPRTQVVCLAEELGELAREINHHYGPKRKKDTEEENDLSMEIADMIFVLCCLANSLSIDLDDAWKRTMEKFSVRDHNRFERSGE